MFLTPTELADLTGKVRSSAQVRALRAMGVEHRVRPDGTVAVLRAHVESLLGAERRPSVSKNATPNWAALAGA